MEGEGEFYVGGWGRLGKGDAIRKQHGRHPVAAPECVHQPNNQTDFVSPPSPVLLFGQSELWTLEILNDRSVLISLMHGFLYITHRNVT